MSYSETSVGSPHSTTPLTAEDFVLLFGMSPGMAALAAAIERGDSTGDIVDVSKLSPEDYGEESDDADS